jgi:hypothetical protein
VVGPRLPDYLAAKYSPWLSPNNFAMGLFGLTLIAVVWARRVRYRLFAHVLVGAMLGLTFLAHTAPAIVLGVTLVGLAVLGGRASGRWRQEGYALGATLATAAVVGSPILVSIVGRYQLRQLNPGPSLAPFGRLDFNETLAFLPDLVTLPFVLGLVGLTAYVWSHRHELAAQILAFGALTCMGYIGFNYARQIGGRLGVRIPSIVPVFHFVLYLHLFAAIGLGIALGVAAAWLTTHIWRRAGGDPDPWVPAATSLTLIMLMVALAFPSYVRRMEYGPRRAEALEIRSVLATDAFAWIQGHTGHRDVFLATDEMALYVVSPAGRKVVATHYYFSNPYVDWDRRDRDRTRMFELLRDCDLAGFAALARPYHVEYVIWSDQVSTLTRGTLGMRVRPDLRTSQIAAAGLEPVFQGRDVSIFRVPSAAQAAAVNGHCKES